MSWGSIIKWGGGAIAGYFGGKFLGLWGNNSDAQAQTQTQTQVQGATTIPQQQAQGIAQGQQTGYQSPYNQQPAINSTFNPTFMGLNSPFATNSLFGSKYANDIFAAPMYQQLAQGAGFNTGFNYGNFPTQQASGQFQTR